VAAVHALAPEFTPDDHPLHLFSQRDLVINFAQTRRGTLRYIFAITDSGPESGAGDRETGRAPA
jgi:hypothetical protein